MKEELAESDGSSYLDFCEQNSDCCGKVCGDNICGVSPVSSAQLLCTTYYRAST